MGERFESDPAAERRPGLGVGAFTGHQGRRLERRAGDLHVCPRCASGLVFPTDWAPARTKSWFVAMRCPDCEWSGGGVYAQKVVDRLDEALDRGTEALLNDLSLLSRANMEADVERLAAAIHDDHILPEDF